ncbi:hypothetical protein STEG23_034389 [Scotinomys teguina]
MATLGLLLLASWALTGTLQLQADARPAPYGVKLCGREFIRAVIFTCGGSRWRRADILAHDSLGDFFRDAEANPDHLASELDEAVGSSEWLALTKSPQAFYGSRSSWQGAPAELQAPGLEVSVVPGSHERALGCYLHAFGGAAAAAAAARDTAPGHSKGTQEVKVPSRQSWVTIPREQYTMADKLLIWGTQEGQPLWSPVFVNLETQMKPDTPTFSDVEISEDEPLEATVLWEPPLWPTHKVLICQFQYKRCQETEWTQLEPQLKTDLLTPVEMQNLEPGTSYQVSGRCRVESGYPWGEWSPDLSFLTPFSAPEDLWVSGTVCETSGKGAALLLWKDPGPCVRVTYRVWFGVGDVTMTQEEVSCCKASIPALMEWAEVSAVNTTNGTLLTNLSLVCLAPESAPHDVVVNSTDGSPGLLVTWRQGTREPREYVVDWARDGDSLDKLNWIRLPTENLSILLPGDFERGVPYRITVTAVFPGGLAAAPSVWGFTEELVSCNTQTVTLPSLHWGSFELWVMVSTVAGQGPPGPSLWLHLPDNEVTWKILPWVLSLWGLLLMGCGLSLATTR